MITSKEEALKVVADAIREALTNMTDTQLLSLVKSPLADFKVKE